MMALREQKLAVLSTRALIIADSDSSPSSCLIFFVCVVARVKGIEGKVMRLPVTFFWKILESNLCNGHNGALEKRAKFALYFSSCILCVCLCVRAPS